MHWSFFIFPLVFLVTSVWIGFQASRSSNTTEYFITRKLGFLATGISAGATANSGFIVTGAVGMGYIMGLSACVYSLAWMLGDLLFWKIVAPRINKLSHALQPDTVPELITKSNHWKILQRVTGAVIVFSLSIYTAAQLSATGKAVATFLDVNITLAIITGAIIVGLYSIMGGFLSSVWTDLLQGILMIILTIGVLCWGILEIGQSEEMFQRLSNNPHLLEWSLSDGVFGGLVFILGFAFSGFGFSLSQPQVTSRIMAAKDKQTIRKASWIYIGFLHFTWIGMCLIGILASTLIPAANDPEAALPQLATTYFSPLIAGAIFAGMLATILSSIDSLIVATGGTISRDIIQHKNLNSKRARFYVGLSCALATFLSLALESTVAQTVLFVVSLLACSVGGAVFIKIFEWQCSEESMISAIIVSIIILALWRYFNLDSIVNDGLVAFMAMLIANKIVFSSKKLARVSTI